MQKKLFYVLLALSLLSILPLVSAYSGGSGNSSNPYQIANCFDLNQTRLNLTSYFKLTANVDCSNTTTWNSGAGFTPIGNSSGLGNITNAFRGNFNGSGFAIQGLYINSTLATAGLFGVTYTSTIYNFTLYQFNITGVNFIGGLSGYSDTDTISYVRLIGNVSSRNNNCGSNGVVTMASAFGAVGYNGASTVHNISSLVDQYMVNCDTSSQNIGGFAAYNNGGTIGDSYYIGYMNFAGTHTSMKIGGFEAQGLGTTFKNVYSVVLNNISGGTAGGLASTATGDTFTTSYWNNQTSGLFTTTGGGTGKNTTAMKLNATFTGFNFSTVWNINETNDYPYLRAINYSSYSLNPTISFTLPTPANATNVTTSFIANISSVGNGNNIAYTVANFYYANGTLYSSQNQSNATMCYQETANVSTYCGGLSTGSYFVNETFSTGSELMYDGNYSTGVSSGLATLYVNYTKPANALNSSLWQYDTLQDTTTTFANTTIPDACWNASSILQLRITPNSGLSARMRLACYNGTTFTTFLTYGTGEITPFVYEEGMFWNMSSINGSTSTNLFNISIPSQATMLFNVTAYTDDGKSASSETRTYFVDTIVAPTWNNFSLTPTTAYANSTLVCAYNFTYATNSSTNVSWYNGSTLLQSTLYTSTSNSSTLVSTIRKNDNIFCNASVQGGIYTITNSSNVTISNSLPVINSLTTNITPVTLFNNFTFITNVTDIDNDITSVNVSVTYGNGTQVNYTTSLSSGVYNTTTIRAQNANYSVSVYAQNGVSLLNNLTLNITDIYAAVPSSYVSTVQAGQNFTFNLTTLGSSSENLSYTYAFTLANASYFNTSSTNATDKFTYNGTHAIIIRTNGSTPDGTYLGNLTINRTIDGQTIVMPLTLGIASQFGQPYIYNLSTLNVAMTSDATSSTTITVNNTGNYTLSSCVPTLTNQFVGWSFYSWSNSSFNVSINGSTNITLTFTTPPAATYDGYVQITCVASAGGVQNSLAPSNQPSVRLVSTTPTPAPTPGGGGGSVTIINGGNATFSISPSMLDVYVSPGSDKTGEIKINNVGNTLLDVTIKINSNVSWTTFSDGGVQTAIQLTPAVGLSSPSQYIVYYITVPTDAAFGDYTAQIIVQGSTATLVQQVNIHVQPSIFANLLSLFTKNIYSTAPVCQAYSVVDQSYCTETAPSFTLYLWEVILCVFVIGGLVIYIF